MHQVKVTSETWTPSELRANMFPGIFGPPQMASGTVKNNLASAGWVVSAEKYLEEVTAMLAPLNAFSTDFSNEVFAVNDPCAVPLVNVEIIKAVGETQRDTSNWETSSINSTSVEVRMTRYSNPFSVSVRETQDGAKLGKYLGTAIKTQAKAVHKDLFEAIKSSAAPVIDGLSLDKFDARYFASKLSGAIQPEVHAALLATEWYSALLPYDRLGLPITNLGVPNVYKSENMELLQADGLSVGLLAESRAIAVAARTPNVEQVPGISVIPLGTYAGIPFVLKQWSAAGVERIYHLVESQIGFQVALPQFLRILSTAAPSV